MPQQQATEHTAANEAIGHLRDVAKTLKELGDTALALEQRTDELLTARADLDATRQQLAETVDREESFQVWREAIEDYERGILDRGELIERTIGGLYVHT